MFYILFGLCALALADLFMVLVGPSLVYGNTGIGRLFGINSALIRIWIYLRLIRIFMPEGELEDMEKWPFYTTIVIGGLWRWWRPRVFEVLNEHGALDYFKNDKKVKKRTGRQSETRPPEHSSTQKEHAKPSSASERPATVKPTAADWLRVPPGAPNAALLIDAWARIDRIRANANAFGEPSLRHVLTRIADTTAEIIVEVIDDRHDFARAREVLVLYLANVDEIATDLRKLDAKGESDAAIANALPVLGAIEAEFLRVKGALFDNDRLNLDDRLRYLMDKLEGDWTTKTKKP